jgi:hypothetical protein
MSVLIGIAKQRDIENIIVVTPKTLTPCTSFNT